MTEINLNVIFNVSESGSHLRCRATRSKSKCYSLVDKLSVDVRGQHSRIVPAGNADHCILDSSSNHSDRKEEYAVVLKLLQELFVVELLVDLLAALPRAV